ncbi:hypothetical protein [Microbulbifer sp. MCCC 1A16149]|uniref:hypothetical protein n=1 Tax=Microbulbifer sp. MCCC 1A16149 TaxID=3411322 RepID=UPI003D123FCD
MSAPTYSVIFRGDLEPGYTVADVKANFARLFKAGPDTVEKLFSGRPLAIKKGMAQAQAEQLQATLSKLGAQSTVRAEGVEQPVPQPAASSPRAPEPQPATAPVADAGETAPAQSAASSSSLSLAPMEGNLVKAHEKTSVEAVKVEVNHLSLKPAEGNLLEAGERKPEVAPAVSVPDWKLDNHISGKASFEVPD